MGEVQRIFLGLRFATLVMEEGGGIKFFPALTSVVRFGQKLGNCLGSDACFFSGGGVVGLLAY